MGVAGRIQWLGHLDRLAECRRDQVTSLLQGLVKTGMPADLRTSLGQVLGTPDKSGMLARGQSCTSQGDAQEKQSKHTHDDKGDSRGWLAAGGVTYSQIALSA